MARPTVTETIYSAGTPARGRVELTLMASEESEAFGYAAGTDLAFLGSVSATLVDGVWSATLNPNSGASTDAITAPTGTVWKIVTHIKGERHASPARYINVPDTAGTLQVQDLLVTVPAPVDPAGLTTQNLAVPGGIATLDASGDLLVSQIPPSVITTSNIAGVVAPAAPDYIVVPDGGGGFLAWQESTRSYAIANASLTSVVQSCITGLGTAGGWIYLDVGAANWGISGSSAPIIPAGITGRLKISASPSTVITLTSFVPCLFYIPNNGSTHQVIQNIDLEDLVVNAGGWTAQNRVGFHQLIFGTKTTAGGTYINTSLRSINVRRFKGYGAVTDPGNKTVLFWFCLALYTSTNDYMVPSGTFAGGPITARDILFEDVTLYGGNAGINILGSGWQTGNGQDTAGPYPAGYTGPTWPGGYDPLYLDNITLSRCYHEMTADGTPLHEGGAITHRRIFLSAALTTASTTIDSPQLAKYPTLRSGETISLTLHAAGTGAGTNLPQTEVVTITAHTLGATTATITRGATPLAFEVGDWGYVPAYGASFHIGSYNQGGRLTVENCVSIGSGDVSFELDGFQDCTLTDSLSVDAQGAGVLYVNYQKVRFPSAQRYVTRGVRMERRQATMGYASQITGPCALGEFTYESCSYFRDASQAPSGSDRAHFGSYGGSNNVSGNGSAGANSTISGSLTNEGFIVNPAVQARAVTFRDVSCTVQGVTANARYNCTEYMIRTDSKATRRLTLDGIRLSFTGTYTGTGKPMISFIELANGSGSTTDTMNLQAKDIHIDVQCTSWPVDVYLIGIHVNKTLANSQTYITGAISGLFASGTGASSGRLQKIQVATSTLVYMSQGRLQLSDIWDVANYCWSHLICMDAAGYTWVTTVNSERLKVLTGAYTMQPWESGVAVSAAAANVTGVQLPTSTQAPGKVVHCAKTDGTANTVTIQSGSANIKPLAGGAAASTFVLTSTTPTAIFQSDGASWNQVG